METNKEPEKIKLPTITELTEDNEMSIKENKLMVLLNQPPPAKWLKEHPIATVKNANGQTVKARYISIDRIEWLLSRIYTKWWVQIMDTKLIANSVVVTVRLHVINPITGKEEWQDGIGAKDIQTDSGKGAMDWNFAKSAGVMLAAPSAETYAVKDAAEKFGKLFGKDINRQGEISYDSLLKSREDLLSYNQKQYIESLLQFSSFAEEKKQYIEGRLNMMNADEAEKLIEDLKDSQVDPINSGHGYNQTYIKEKLDRENK